MRAVYFVLALAFSGCFAGSAPKVPVSCWAGGACSDLERTCKAACAHVKALSCPQGEGSDPTDVNSCAKECVHTGAKSGLFTCWAKASDCDAVLHCN